MRVPDSRDLSALCFISVVALWGCDPPPAPVSTLVPLDAARLARRLSIDIRGVLPSGDELEALEADPGQVETLKEQWLADPLFEERVVQLYQEQWFTVLDGFVVSREDYGVSPAHNYEYVHSVGEEPLRTVARVVATDQPYSSITTVDWTMANPTLEGIWPIDYPDGESGWQVSHYTDGRPAAGVLSTNGLWWRYPTALNNNNRLRAAAIFKLLVCTDLLSRPVSLSTDVDIDQSDPSEAIRTDPACQACHASIEPVAATLFGFYPYNDQSAVELEYYHPEREGLGPELLQVEPAWQGDPVTGLADLGLAIAADPLFAECAVQTVAKGLLRRDLYERDADLLIAAEASFARAENLKDAIRAVTASESYAAGGFTVLADAETIAETSTRRMLVTSQLRSIAGGLVGLDWNVDGYDQLDNDASGYRVLGGAVDGYDVFSPQRLPSLTSALTLQRVAEVTAALIVARDLREGATPQLLIGITTATVQADPAFAEGIRAAFWQLLSGHPTDEDVVELAAAWQAVIDAGGTPQEAWTCVLAVLLRDPEFVSY